MDSYYGERTAHILADTVSTILRYDDAFAGMDFASTTPLLDSGSSPIQDGIRRRSDSPFLTRRVASRDRKA